MDLSGKVVIVTGASSGIGAVLSTQLLRGGARVVLAARRADRIREVLDSVGAPHQGLALPTDVGRHEDLEALVQGTLDRFGALDIVVNNAGIGVSGALHEVGADDIERQVRVNLLAPMWLTRLALPHLLERDRAMVVNVASMAAHAPMPFQATYAATKGGLRSFSRSLRRELRGTGVHVLVACPGVVDTPMIDGMREKAAELDFRMSIQPADEVAADLLEAIRRERREVVGSSFADRMIARLDTYAPRLVDQVVARLRPRLRQVMMARPEELLGPPQHDDAGEP